MLELVKVELDVWLDEVESTRLEVVEVGNVVDVLGPKHSSGTLKSSVYLGTLVALEPNPRDANAFQIVHT